MAKKSAAVRKQMAQQVEANAQAAHERVVQQQQAAQPAAPAPIRGPLNVTITLDGKTVDVASQPLVTGEDMGRVGKALTRLCYNLMNGTLSSEIRDTSADCWRGVDNSNKVAFRFLRDILDGSEKLPAPILERIKGLDTAGRAGFIRNSWSAYVAGVAAKKEEAQQKGERSNVRVREVTLQALKKLFKGNAPKGGGVQGIKEKVRVELDACLKALKAKKWEVLKKHLEAAYSMTESEKKEEAPAA